MKIFVTGGTGFIGSHIVKELSNQGHSVIVLARNIHKVPALGFLPGVKLIPGDIGDVESYIPVLSDVDAVIHVALYWGNSAVEMLMNDTKSSVQLFELAAKAGVKNIIYTSSTAVNDWVYMDESAREFGSKATVYEDTKQNPVTCYGATKGATELYLQATAFEYKIRANIVRPGYTFGNPAVAGGNIEADTRFSSIIENALIGKPIEVIKNDGTQFIDASDLSRIYLAILDSEVNGKTYFGLGNRFITWEEVAIETLKITGSKSELVVKDLGWPAHPALFDVTAIHRDFNMSFNSWRRIVEHLNYLIT